MATSNHQFDDSKIVRGIHADPSMIVAQSMPADVDFTPDTESEGFYAHVTVTERYKIPADKARDLLRDAL